jgi:deoxyribonuclease V
VKKAVAREEPLHEWVESPDEAIALQERLRLQLVLGWGEVEIDAVAGVAVVAKGGLLHAGIAVLTYPELGIVETSQAECAETFPYIPGLLAFREGPAITQAWERLRHEPDLVLFEGHGFAHPRRFGLACHMGLWLGVPSIGVARRRLFGIHAPPGPLRGDMCPVLDPDEPGMIIGMFVRTLLGVRPIYVSAGHRMDLEHAVAFTLGCCRRHRMPEPIRLARLAASRQDLGPPQASRS